MSAQAPASLRPAATDGRAQLPAARANPLWTWFTSGNVLTRIGVVVMFFGVAFLLKYFAEHFTVPIELRLAAVAGFGVALIALGLRLAAARPGYGLSLQGAGAGVLYLSIYAAFRLYGVLPAAPAIVLLVAVAALTIYLAVRADSQPLAALAIAGGFLAPVLVGNDGDPLLLFGYFAVLNAAIFALAWARAWRALNAVGFVFTFVPGLRRGAPSSTTPRITRSCSRSWRSSSSSTWRSRSSTCVARRSPSRTRSTACWSSASRWRDSRCRRRSCTNFRMASRGARSRSRVSYAVLFLATRRRAEPGFALLSRAFLALAVIFATIAIPFALDDRYTAAVVGGRGGRRVLDRRAAERAARACVRARRRSRRRGRVRAVGVFRCRRPDIRQCAFRGRDADRRFGPRDGVRRRARHERARPRERTRSCLTCSAGACSGGSPPAASSSCDICRARTSRTPCSPG